MWRMVWSRAISVYMWYPGQETCSGPSACVSDMQTNLHDSKTSTLFNPESILPLSYLNPREKNEEDSLWPIQSSARKAHQIILGSSQDVSINWVWSYFSSSSDAGIWLYKTSETLKAYLGLDMVMPWKTFCIEGKWGADSNLNAFSMIEKRTLYSAELASGASLSAGNASAGKSIWGF